MRFREDIDKVKERLFAFWENECIDRACVKVTAPKIPGAHISMFSNDKDLSEDGSVAM